MERSIETIWKEGFLRNDALVAPKLNNLYNRKSQHLIDKFKRMFKRNITFVIILAVVHLAICLVVGVPSIGVVLFLLFLPLIIASKSEMKKVELIDRSVSSYEYLKTFDSWLKSSLKRFGKIYQFFYPIYFPSIVLGLFFTNFLKPEGSSLIEKIMSRSSTYMVQGYPVWWILSFITLVVASALVSQKLYKFDLDIVYGRAFKKLEEILADMEELKK